jgi:ABC-type transport system involved in multi-copper enzyme maturation permease subunit
MTATTTDRTASPAPASAGRDRFPHLLRAEWTKLRTVRGWIAGLVIAVLVTLGLGLLAAADGYVSCAGDIPPTGAGGPCDPSSPAIGPDGEAVRDDPYLVGQSLSGDGSITGRVTSLAGRTAGQAGTEPWAKAGLMIKAGTAPGSTYAAVLVTAEHGVRMQHDFTHDVAGRPAGVSASSPRWLRLVRSGDTVTGYESADGESWRRVGVTELSGLGTSATVGMFVASPDHEETAQTFGGSSTTGGPSLAEGTFDSVTLGDGWRAAAAWAGVDIGGKRLDPASGEGFRTAGEGFTITAAGDSAPLLAGPSGGLDRDLTGLFAGLIAVIVVATMFVTAEYRRGMVRTTFAASPRRGRVLVAKAVVIGAAAFVTGLVATVLCLWLVGDLRSDRGLGTLPVPLRTEARVVVGTAGLVAVTAVIALAVGTILRRSAGAVTLAIALVVLPYIVAAAFILPQGPAEWLMRVTPAAGFAVQQSFPKYDHVAGAYLMSDGYYPIPPWGGFAVLCAWAAAALALATWLVNRRDA